MAAKHRVKKKVSRHTKETDKDQDTRNQARFRVLGQSDSGPARILNVRPDLVDFRDKLFEPTLIEVPEVMELETYIARGVEVLDQGQEGACTGYALASVAHFLLRTRERDPDTSLVSPRMLYEMAKRYDEWPENDEWIDTDGDGYEDEGGSSIRAAVKGWHKHGVCSSDLWPSRGLGHPGELTDPRAVEAASRPLGAYYRVDPQDLVAMHAALAEVGILYVSSVVHTGWDHVGANGLIKFNRKVKIDGAHAFVIVGYDSDGFWIQNSWGDAWGHRGYGHMSYTDWIQNAMDVWVARLGVPINVQSDGPSSETKSLARRGSLSHRDLRPHIVSIGNDGALRYTGTYGTNKAAVDEIVSNDIPRMTGSWAKKRILLYAHGGLVSEKSAIQRIADYRAPLLANEIFPIGLVWKSDFWTTLVNILQDAIRRRRPEGIFDGVKDFVLDRLDDGLEPLARNLGGKSQWDEMKENATLATTSTKGGVRYLLNQLCQAHSDAEIHLVGHSAGAILLAPMIDHLNEQLAARDQAPIKSLTLWAPACTVALFKHHYLPAINEGRIEHTAVYTLSDKAEQDDDCANIYHKSLLYLVSNAFEEKARIPLYRDGEPLLGLAKSIVSDSELKNLFRVNTRKKQRTRANVEWVICPNSDDGRWSSDTTSHGGFSSDKKTVLSTLARILGKAPTASKSDMSLTAEGDSRHEVFKQLKH